MAEEENIARELHGHLTQMLRTALSGGLQMTEQRARRRQHEAEAERRIAAETARQLEERKRAEREANAFLAQQSIIREEAERAGHAGRAVGTAVETAVETRGRRHFQYPSTRPWHKHARTRPSRHRQGVSPAGTGRIEANSRSRTLGSYPLCPIALYPDTGAAVLAYPGDRLVWQSQGCLRVALANYAGRRPT